MKQGVALSQLADILPPPSPGGPDWLLLMVLGGVCVVIVAAVLWFIKKHSSLRSNSPAREARRRLGTLRTAWQSHTLTDREAAYRLATLLRLGLAVPQLDAQQPPSVVEDDNTWRETLQQLNVLRYRDQPRLSLSSHCFDRAEHWLTTAQRQAR